MNASHARTTGRASTRQGDDVQAAGGAVSAAPDNVVALTARTSRVPFGAREGEDAGQAGRDSEEQLARHGLLTLSIEHSVPQVGHYTRLLSASTAMSVAELVEAILVTFRWPEVPEFWTFRVKNRGTVTMYAPGRLGATEQMLGVRSVGTSVGESLSKGCVAQLQVGAFNFLLQATDMVKHQDIDPTAVLLGAEFLPAADQFGRTLTEAEALHPLGIPTAVQLSEVNIELAGEDTVEQVMADVQPELKALLHDGELYEYVPLLQALDLERPSTVSDRAAELLADAPSEESAVGRAAAWARIVALSTLVDADSVDEVSESFMQAVGYRRGDVDFAAEGIDVTALSSASEEVGGLATMDNLEKWDAGELDPDELDPEDPLTAAEIRELSRHTGYLLALAGAGGWGLRPDQPVPLVPRCSVLERLELYRFLLQR